MRRLIAVAVALAACTTPRPIDVTSASMRGLVAATTPDGRYLIESPAGSPGVGKCVVRITPDTELINVDGTAIELPLAVGSEVSVWFTGPIMKSYPAQATASRLVVHSHAQ
jgi:hypothetical protein